MRIDCYKNNRRRMMGNQPKVSIIMPSLNVQEYIHECIESVLNQTMKEIEVICVDAGSTDGTLEILREYEQKDSRVQVIVSDKKSYGYQMNLGQDAAKGEYIGIVETDDWVKSDMFAVLYKLAKKKNLDIIKSDFQRFVYENNKLICTYNQLCKRPGYYKKVLKPTEDVMVFKFVMNTWCGIYKTDFIRENNIRYNETPGASYQDNGFWFKTMALAERVMFLNKAHYMNRRDNPNSSVHSREKVYCINDEYAFIREFLAERPELEAKLMPIFCVKKYDNYDFTYHRVGEEFKLEYIQTFAEEFRQHREEGLLDEALFEPGRWVKIIRIMQSPETYHSMMLEEQIEKPLTVELLLEENEYLRNEMMALRQTASYRIGSAITWVPRRIRGIIACYQEHGMRYTLSRIPNKFKK